MRKKRREHDWMLPLAYRAPVDPQELRFFFELGQAAASQKMPIVSPECRPIHLEDTNGEITSVVFRDTPFARAAIAISQHIKHSSSEPEDVLFAKSMSIQFRIQGLIEIIEHPLAKGWCRESGESVRMHEAIMDAASTAELQGDGKFEPKPFFDFVQKIADEKYSGEWA